MREKPYTSKELLEELHGVLKESNQYPDIFESYDLKVKDVIIDSSCFIKYEKYHAGKELHLAVRLNIERDDNVVESYDFVDYKVKAGSKEANYELEPFAARLNMALCRFQDNCLEDFVWKGYKMNFLKGNKDLMMLADSKEEIVDRYNARREFFSNCTGCKIINYATRKEQIISEDNISNGFLDISQIAV